MKGLKTGGRQKGTPNKATTVVADILQAQNMNLIEEAIGLYSSASDSEFKLKVLSLLIPYVYPKRVDAHPDDSLDVTPETSASEALDYIKENFPQLLTGKDE